jgi:hypothetical protein
LKTIYLLQFLMTPRGSSYDVDDNVFLLDCSDVKTTLVKCTEQHVDLSDVEIESTAKLYAIHYLSCYCVNVVLKECSDCHMCIVAVTAPQCAKITDISILTENKNHVPDSLIYASDTVIDLIVRTEDLIRQHEPNFSSMTNIANYLLNVALSETIQYIQSRSHDIKQKLIKKIYQHQSSTLLPKQK